MSERYQLISEQTYENAVLGEAPVAPERIRILYDKTMRKAVVHFTFRNISTDAADKVCIRASFYDDDKKMWNLLTST